MCNSCTLDLVQILDCGSNWVIKKKAYYDIFQIYRKNNNINVIHTLLCNVDAIVDAMDLQYTHLNIHFIKCPCAYTFTIVFLVQQGNSALVIMTEGCAHLWWVKLLYLICWFMTVYLLLNVHIKPSMKKLA